MWPDGPHHMQVGTGGAHKVSAECAGHSVLEEGAIYSCYLQSSLRQPVHPPPKDDPWFHDEGVETKMKGISNPLGQSGGAYLVFGPKQHWTKEGHYCFGGRGIYNPVLAVMNYFLDRLHDNLPGFNPDKYVDKVGTVLTVDDYIQIPHLDANVKSMDRSWIYHAPLCHSGSYIYVWKSGNGDMERKLIKIPFGSCLILRDDVWHGGIVGGKGNIRLHGGVFEAGDAASTNHLVYGTDGNVEEVFSSLKGMEVNYGDSINLLPEQQTKDIKDIIKFQLDTCIFDELFYSNIYLN